MKKIAAGLLVAALAGAGVAATATAASASGEEICEVGVYVHTRPHVSTGNPIYVETGEYEPYTTCV